MAQWRGFLAGLGVGAVVMYLWDPERGLGRREHVARQWRAASHGLRRVAKQGNDGLWVGLQGLQAGWRALHEFPAGTHDQGLAARVRRGLNRLLRDASLIDVKVQAGQVTLTGSVHAEDAARAVQFTQGVSGVLTVQNHLEFRH